MHSVYPSQLAKRGWGHLIKYPGETNLKKLVDPGKQCERLRYILKNKIWFFLIDLKTD